MSLVIQGLRCLGVRDISEQYQESSWEMFVVSSEMISVPTSKYKVHSDKFKTSHIKCHCCLITINLMTACVNQQCFGLSVLHICSKKTHIFILVSLGKTCRVHVNPLYLSEIYSEMSRIHSGACIATPFNVAMKTLFNH